MPVEIRPRFFYDNYLFLATSLPVASSEAATVLGNVQKEGAGAGTVTPSGTFAASEDREFYVQIVIPGVSGIAQFFWSPDAAALVTSAIFLTTSTPKVLQDGISIAFPGDAAYDIDDTFRFRAVRPHGANKMTDGDRDTEYRSATVAAVIRIDADLGSARTPKVFALKDHNLSATASLKLQASSSASYSSLAVDLPIGIPLDSSGTPTGDIVQYLDTDWTYRYWRIEVSDGLNIDGYVRWSEAYLGAYLELPLMVGDQEAVERASPQRRMQSGRWTGL